MTLKPVNGKTTVWLAALMFLAGIALTYFTGFGEVRAEVKVQAARIDSVCKTVDVDRAVLDERLDRIEIKLDDLIARR